MKFSEIDVQQWDELQPYLDTCLLPVTGMNGSESPPEATQCLEDLRDIMDLVEIPFKGRVVTYPACHYTSDDQSSLEGWTAALKGIGFKYVILITANPRLRLLGRNADLVIAPDGDGKLPTQDDVSLRIRSLWNGKTT